MTQSEETCKNLIRCFHGGPLKSARGLAHSKSFATARALRIARSVLDCGSPLPLSLRGFPGRSRFANALEDDVGDEGFGADAFGVPEALAFFFGWVAPGGLVLFEAFL